MVSMALAVTVLGILGTYLFYGTLSYFAPQLLPSEDSWIPAPLEVGWMTLTAIISMSLASIFAVRLSRRILKPINSVADSLRSLAGGNLEARAQTDDHSLGEAAQLVSDFNGMAERIQRMENERKFWNAAIAHELRTPITILRGRLQGLSEGVFEPDAKLFHNLLTQVESLGRLVEDLRIVGLADSGNLHLQLEAIDVSQEVQGVIHAMQPRLTEAGFGISSTMSESKVVCDPVRIRQAILALLENAVLHATPGLLQVTVAQQEGVCKISVEDSGPGMSASVAEKLFDAFQRGDTKARGNGLGLAVVRAIAHAHGGTVAYHPSPLGGSNFLLSWPTINS
ncbi:ATP-binding protein [Chitinimonas sp.]|uniref:ATP-binding protein n=1 Tax=Chitinimonas sp. TaxID=1934313 RepID=UPI002F94D56C